MKHRKQTYKNMYEKFNNCILQNELIKTWLIDWCTYIEAGIEITTDIFALLNYIVFTSSSNVPTFQLYNSAYARSNLIQVHTNTLKKKKNRSFLEIYKNNHYIYSFKILIAKS